MILNSTNPCNDKAPWRAALEDALVIGLVAFFSALIATQEWPPSDQTLWATGAAAALAGLVAWAKARQITTDLKNG